MLVPVGADVDVDATAELVGALTVDELGLACSSANVSESEHPAIKGESDGGTGREDVSDSCPDSTRPLGLLTLECRQIPLPQAAARTAARSSSFSTAV
ncbi:hypothetical protein GS892_15425 [Rhodococcus hoagii]|nr:hypothetical protein [Prescottella equi]